MIKGFQQDLINFIGHRVVTAYREIKPKLLLATSGDEEACAKQEAVYLMGLADGLALAELLTIRKQGDQDF
jgi:hypothetical protein